MSIFATIINGIKKALTPPSRIYLDVPFAAKDEAKSLGARWDPDRTAWFIWSSQAQGPFEKWMPGSTQYNRIYLKVPDEEKDQVRDLGGLWDTNERRWYVLQYSYSAHFSRWLRIDAILVDPIMRAVRQISIEDYAKDYLGNPLDSAEANRVWASWEALVAGDGAHSRGHMSFGDGVVAKIDDMGLLRERPAFWRLDYGPDEKRDVRAGRYLICGMTPSVAKSEYEYTISFETDVPAAYGLAFWRSNVVFLDYDMGHQWCVARGIRK